MEAVVERHDVEAELKVYLAVCKHGDVVAGPSVAEDNGTLSAVLEPVLVGVDDAAVEVVPELGSVGEFLDPMAFEHRIEVQSVPFYPLLTGAFVVVGVWNGHDFRKVDCGDI